MSSIHTLTIDIQELLKDKGGWFSNELSNSFSSEIATRLSSSFNAGDRIPGLRLSKMGDCCPRALWYSVHKPEEAEALPPWAEFKYAFGHVIEALAISLAKAAGHSVVGEQDEVVVDGVVGHRDCIIDGCLVDVKSCSSIAFQKFKTGSIRGNDSFGYLDQLDGYLAGSADDPLLIVKDKAYILAIDKTLGHMCLYEHSYRKSHIRERIAKYKLVVARTEPPACECKTIAYGLAGNLALDTRASYSPQKHTCFPNLRTFLYASGPVYLTKVIRKPDVMEVDRHGKVVLSN